MAGGNQLGISALWKTGDWLAVWRGFLIIILILGGLIVSLPKFKRTTDGEFAQLAESKTPEVTAFAAQAAARGEAGVAASAAPHATRSPMQPAPKTTDLAAARRGLPAPAHHHSLHT
ncbi:hypothetical protein [Nitratidesulfovibrio sp. SRB-5]|uniref:hypothetical protein n=1 Tax=Nitratidesulfovibrio sp. SRB-5 TaxID=2872636 RepID=UPI00167ED2D8|nr:hypothetical protein [Nitratidesulfovibrio sp. SRB-5]MBZ2171167.1 hypothetical protein [Nitratidesulfovibrio sp. SRB-5]